MTRNNANKATTGLVIHKERGETSPATRTIKDHFFEKNPRSIALLGLKQWIITPPAPTGNIIRRRTPRQKHLMNVS